VPVEQRREFVNAVVADMQTVRSMNGPHEAIESLTDEGYTTADQAAIAINRLQMENFDRWLQRQEQDLAVQTPSGGMATVRRKKARNQGTSISG